MPFIFLRLGLSLIAAALAESVFIHDSASDSAPAVDGPSFRMAVETGNAEAVRRLLAAGAPVDQPIAYRGTALHVAAAQNNAPLVQFLLDAGADVRATNEYRSTPLMTAAGNGARECAQLLLDRGAQINAVDAYGHSAIARAIQRGQLDMLDFLADRGADLDATSNEGWNLLHLAAVEDDPDVVRWCIRRNLPLDALKKGDCSALYLAVANGQTNAVQALLEAGADANLATTNGLWTPLMKAARDGNVGLARLLLSAGADPEKRRHDGTTALLVAAAHGSTEMIDLLLDAGARTDAFNDYGAGVLRMAMGTTNLAAFTHFLERNVDPDLAPAGKWPVISGVAWDGQVGFIEALLAAGADPDRTTPDGQTPLFIAMRRSQTNVVEQLLAAGADPALRKNEDCLTPWHLAILHGQREMAEQLELRMTPEQMAPTELVRAYLDLDAPLATNVSVAGLFNEWDATATPLARRADDGWWYVELDLFPASYGYKFVVDGNWIEDPRAEKSYRDGNRNTENSQFNPVDRRVETRPVRPVSSADALIPVRFEYRDRTARYVSVAGEFNGWNTANHQLALEKVGLWSAELRIPAGEYAYKFVVDGQWLLDPSNALTKVVAGATNSLVVVQPSAGATP
ncbi:MAG: ankyrin repeat domain-containing protein [Kiritimatiellia bacterium]